MTTLALYASAAGFIQSGSATYSLARSGGDTVDAITSGDVQSGQFPQGASYFCLEVFLAFDTSSIPADATISSVVLSLDGVFDLATQAFTHEVRVRDWGTSLTAADWVAGANLSALTRLATLASSAYASGYAAFTEDGENFRNAIVKGGTTRFLIASDRLAAGNAPAVSESQTFEGNPLQAGSPDPKLVITYTAPTTVTPGVAALTTAPFAPVASVGQFITPGTPATVLSAFAPTIDTGIRGTPTPGSLVAATFAPNIIIPQSFIPGVLGLLTATFAPNANSGANVAPDPLTALLQTFAPAVLLSGNILLVPEPFALLVVTFAPALLVVERVHTDWPPPGTGRWNRAPGSGIGIIRTAPPPGSGLWRPTPPPGGGYRRP